MFMMVVRCSNGTHGVGLFRNMFSNFIMLGNLTDAQVNLSLRRVDRTCFQLYMYFKQA